MCCALKLYEGFLIQNTSSFLNDIEFSDEDLDSESESPEEEIERFIIKNELNIKDIRIEIIKDINVEI